MSPDPTRSAASPEPGVAPRLYAGFAPDLAFDAAFRGLAPERDDLDVLSPLVTRRDLILSDGGERRVRALIYVAGHDGADARAAAAAHLAGIPRPLDLVPAPAAAIVLGETAWLEEARDGYTHIVFARRNVVVDLAEWGTEPSPLLGIARNLDDQLRASPAYDRAELESLRPRIETLYLAERPAPSGPQVPLVLAARCPRGLPLQYDFTASDGAVNRVSADPPRFFYEPGPASGPRLLTVCVTGASGLTAVRRLDVGVGDGLGHPAGAAP